MYYSDTAKLAHAWANQNAENGKTGAAIYFEGTIIYSYGYYFPIAQYTKDKDKNTICLFTLKTRSVTTSCHISAVSSANWKECVYMYNLPGEDLETNRYFYFDGSMSLFHRNNIKLFEADIQAAVDKMPRARKKEIYITSIQETVRKIVNYVSFFGISIDDKLQSLLNSADVDSFNEYMSTEKERIEAEDKKAKEIAAKTGKAALAKWRKFDVVRLYNKPDAKYDHLRYDVKKKRFETSQQVEIPLKIAKDFYKQILSVIAGGGCVNGGCASLIGRFMGEYEIRGICKEYIHIGCHKIQLKEINRFKAIIS